MITSINPSSATALRVLSGIGRSLEKTQMRISEGLKVATAKDDAAVWSVATMVRSDTNAVRQIRDNLTVLDSALNVAREGAEKIAELAGEIKERIVFGSDCNVDVSLDVAAKFDAIQQIIESSSFNGINLLNQISERRVPSYVSQGTAQYLKVRGFDLRIINAIDTESCGIKAITRSTSRQTTEYTSTFSQIDVVQDNTRVQPVKVITGSVHSFTIDNSPTPFGNIDDLFTAISVGDIISLDGTPLAFTVQPADIMGTRAATGAQIASRLQDVVRTLPGLSAATVSYTDAPQPEFSFSGPNIEQDVGGIVLSRPTTTDIAVLFEDGTQEVFPNATLNDLIGGRITSSTWNGTSLTLTSNYGPIADVVDLTADNTEISYGPGNVTTKSVQTTVETNEEIVGYEDAFESRLDLIEEYMQYAIDAATAFGSLQTRIELHTEFLNNAIDQLDEGVGQLVDANIQEESARLIALQAQKQLATQSLSIANNAPQSLLTLFGGQ